MNQNVANFFCSTEAAFVVERFDCIVVCNHSGGMVPSMLSMCTFDLTVCLRVLIAGQWQSQNGSTPSESSLKSHLQTMSVTAVGERTILDSSVPRER